MNICSVKVNKKHTCGNPGFMPDSACVYSESVGFPLRRVWKGGALIMSTKHDIFPKQNAGTSQKRRRNNRKKGFFPFLLFKKDVQGNSKKGIMYGKRVVIRGMKLLCLVCASFSRPLASSHATESCILEVEKREVIEVPPIQTLPGTNERWCENSSKEGGFFFKKCFWIWEETAGFRN